MSEIKIDLNDLITERMCQFEDGRNFGIDEGISIVMKWLESNKRLYDFLNDNGWPVHKYIHKESHWYRIAKSLGREEEINKL